MRLIFLNRYFYPDHSATSQLLSDLAFALAQQDFTVHVITSRQRYDQADAALSAYEIVDNVQVHRVWTTRFGRASLPGRALDYLSFYISVSYRLWRLLNSGDTVIAKTDPPLLSVFAAVICKIRNARLINWLQDLFPEVAEALQVKGMSTTVVRILRRWRNRSLVAAEQNVVLGKHMRQVLVNQGIPEHKLTVIPNWADNKAIYPVPAKSNPLRQQWQLQQQFVIVYSGNVGRAHDFSTLITAARLLLEHNDITFILIGDGYYKPWLVQQITDLQLSNVHLYPYQPRHTLHQTLSLADVHIVSLLPQLEGYIVPSKIYGIAAAGRAIVFIGDQQGEVADLLAQADCGVAVPVGAGEELAKQLVGLKNSPRQCSEWGQNAFTRLLFTKQQALGAWRALITASRLWQ